jgi:MFS family permease
VNKFTSPAARVTLVMSCLFGTTGVIMVFLPRWLEVERALSGAEIGLVLSLAQFARILTGPAIAFWADGAGDRRTPLRVVAAATLAVYGAFFFLAHEFWSLLALGFIALSLQQALTPLIEAAILRATADGKVSYGLARGLGSVAFIAANIAGGVLVARFGLGAAVVWILLGISSVFASSLCANQLDIDGRPRFHKTHREIHRAAITSSSWSSGSVTSRKIAAMSSAEMTAKSLSSGTTKIPHKSMDAGLTVNCPVLNTVGRCRPLGKR